MKKGIMKRDSAKIFDDLINLNADEWNLLLSNELNIPIGSIKDLILSRELKVDVDLAKVNIDKKQIEKMGSTQKKEDVEGIYISKKVGKAFRPSLLDKYMVKLDHGEEIISSIICTGKIVVGLDFSSSQIADSYLCHCTFYNCDFSNVNMEGAIINSCTFNNCKFNKSDLTGSTLSRNKFIECDIKGATWDYVVMTDCAAVVCNFNRSSFIQSKVLFTGLSDCKAKNSIWKDVEFVQISYSNTVFENSSFKRARMAEAILIRTNFNKCDFDSFTVGAITATMCDYEEKHKHFFKNSDVYYSPSTFEWEKNPNE